MNNCLFFPSAFRLSGLCVFVLVSLLSSYSLGQFSSIQMEEKGTILRNAGKLFPPQDLAAQRTLVLSIGVEERSIFQATAALYSSTTELQLSKRPSEEQLQSVKKEISAHDLCLIGLHGIPRYEEGVDYSSSLIQMIQDLSAQDHIVFCLFGREDRLSQFPGLGIASGLLHIDSDESEAQSWAAQVIFGGMGARGKLSLDLGPSFRAGDGLEMNGGSRLAYLSPASIGWDEQALTQGLEAVIQEGLDAKAFPGCQVIAVQRLERWFFHRAYGYHTYDSLRPVALTDVYDYASMTKVTGALPALMQLVDQKKIDLDQPLATYWEDLKRSNKKKLTVREILAHQARLKAWIAYYEDTKRKNGTFKRGIYSRDSSERYPVKVGSSLYLNRKYRKKIYKAIRKSDLNAETRLFIFRTKFLSISGNHPGA